MEPQLWELWLGGGTISVHLSALVIISRLSSSSENQDNQSAYYLFAIFGMKNAAFRLRACE
jgi:hypothetical protein